MPIALTVENKLFSIQKSQDFHGAKVPWEAVSYASDYETANTSGGVFDLSDFGIANLTGVDAKDFLQRMSTICFKMFDAQKVSYGAFLTGKGTVICLGTFQQVAPASYDFIVSPPQRERALEHIEQFHFGETFTTTDRTPELAILGLWQPGIFPGSDFESMKTFSPSVVVSQTAFGISYEAWRDEERPELFWAKVKRDQAVSFLNGLKELGVALLGQRLFEFFRIEKAVPAVGCELTEKDIILEANFDKAVARNKGCYPGQEVVERIFTYGQVNKKLFPVLVEGTSSRPFPKLPFPLLSEDPKAGTVISLEPYPDKPQRAVALAYINRRFWEQNRFQADAETTISRR